MIFEIAHIAVKPGMESAFEQGVAEAAPLFQRAKGCHGLSLQRGIEEPTHYRLVVRWETVEDHTVHFRNSEDFQSWRALVGHCFESAPRVEHVATVLQPF
ncbi:antibiotic biosynthesis monooxygenase family protein [Azohydromonas australica]|uniref:antibiotic biosynthesis monooxygenase family protein n=1 Tax=Azohydromonas australica TaxID=364039 RepID=UPI0004024B40|nr:antibiotic biosynthesis monooxygenase family protein [Azohydromonas australica]